MHDYDGNSFLDIPAREGKPRERGLTHVMDKGLNLREIEGLFDTAGEYVDIVKLGWGTSYVTNNLEKKVALYRSFSTPVVCGGTLFEAVYGKDKMDDFKRWLEHYRFSHVEISDGTLDIPREQKLELIADFARDFVVLSEVGLEGLRGQHRPVPMGAVDARGARCGRLEGDRRGPRGRHRRHLPPDRRAPDGPRGRDRALDQLPRPDLGDADEELRRPGSCGTSVPRSTSATSRPTRSSRSRRCASGCAPTR